MFTSLAFSWKGLHSFEFKDIYPLFFFLSQRTPEDYNMHSQGLVRRPGICFRFCHWFSEGFSSCVMHKFIFFTFPSLTYYFPLTILKYLHDMHGFLPSPHFHVTALFSVCVTYSDVCLLWMPTKPWCSQSSNHL